MIHRAILGSFERFIGILTEHYAGEFPLSIAPTGVIIVPITNAHNDYAKELSKELQLIDIDSEIFNKNDSLNKRIRTAEKQRVPMILVIGDKEIEQNMVALRDRRERKQYNLTRTKFFELLKEKMDEVQF